MIRVSNIDPKSSLKKQELGLITSSTLAAVAGILPYQCQMDRFYVGATAAVSTLYITVSINGSAQSVFAASSVGADGVSFVDPGNDRFISAGSLVEYAVSATAAFAAVSVLGTYKLRDSGK
jgi:hypothetical protein